MPLDLPVPRKGRLARSPLALAVCQVRYEDLPSVTGSQAMLAIHQSLGGRKGQYPIAEQFELTTLNVQIVGPAPQSPTSVIKKGWRLRSEDSRWAITLMPDHVALETTKYTTWEDDFRIRLAALLDAVTEHVRPTIEQRLGLRYVNRIVEPKVGKPTELRDYIASELLGLILHEDFGEMVSGAQQQLDLDAGEGVHIAMRHGFIRDGDREGAPTYLIDFDIFRQGVQAFDVEDIKVSADSFNELALRLFQRSLTEKMLTYLEGAGDVRVSL
jgi:uncharacterized protein (TIGR04255 family)